MDSFEFLGGRYNRPEQILSGPMQAFRAQNAATDTIVFIHRVSTKEAPEEQAALLKLLTTALVKSTDAKRLVLDFGEEHGYWYVVTESDPKCALLREWLQSEIKTANPTSLVELSSKVAPPTSPASTPKQPEDAGEFTRFLTRDPLPKANQDQGISEFTRVFQTSTNTPAAAIPPISRGEFTSFFRSSDAQIPEAKPSHSVAPPDPIEESRPVIPPPPSAPESLGLGEFTRFFSGGLPPSPPNTAPIVSPPPINRPFVQRPNTPVPPPPANAASKSKEEGEFTRIFSRPANAPPVMRPSGATYPPSSRNDDADPIFGQKIEIPSPVAPSRPPHSEFTRMFGSVGDASSAATPPAVVAQPRVNSLLEHNPNATQEVPQAPKSPTKDPAPNVPSEFTRIIQGIKPTGEVEPPSISPKVAVPALKIPARPLPDPPAVKIPDPAFSAAPDVSGNKKLVILFSILAVLAVVLILLVVFVVKK